MCNGVYDVDPGQIMKLSKTMDATSNSFIRVLIVFLGQCLKEVLVYFPDGWLVVAGINKLNGYFHISQPFLIVIPCNESFIWC